MRNPLYMIYGLLLLFSSAYGEYYGWSLSRINQVKNVPKSVRDNPGAGTGKVPGKSGSRRCGQTSWRLCPNDGLLESNYCSKRPYTNDPCLRHAPPLNPRPTPAFALLAPHPRVPEAQRPHT